MDQVELNETRNKLEEREGELKVCLVKVKSQEGGEEEKAAPEAGQ